jgi:two-component system, LytTR family, sensor kinase
VTGRKKIYWLAQISGWGLFVLGNILSASFQEINYPNIHSSLGDISSIYLISLFIFFIGIFSTHLFRSLVIQWKWSVMSIGRLLPRMLLAAFVLSLCFTTFNTLMTDLISGEIPLVKSTRSVYFWQNVLNFMVIFMLWEIIYFAVHVFENWKKEEILNLQLTASKTEFELQSLKAQMNPHFMFNSMNSIRALVDENPEKAKQAITMLSVILRSNLTLGKKQTIPLKEELELVEKYLALEKIRFEERLQVKLDIEPEMLQFEIPPFMLQTLVENGVKHGVSKQLMGGEIRITVAGSKDSMMIAIANSGTYQPKHNGEGIGLINTRQRLKLLYGNLAGIDVTSSQNEVTISVIIPIHNQST